MSFLVRFHLSFCLTAFVALLALPLSVGDAVAASRQAQEKAARKACLSGDYAAGVAILSDLFVETGAMNLIFNQGRCFEQNRRYEDAIARFQEYLRAGRDKLRDSDKAEAEKHIADCKQMLAQERELAPAKITPEPSFIPPPAPPPQKTETPTEPVETVAKPAAEADSASDGAGLRIGGIVTAAIGAAGIGAGIFFQARANAAVDDMYKTPDGYNGKETDRKTFTTLGWVGYGVGAACLATGTILYLVGNAKRSSQSSSLALSPTFGTANTGVALTGAF